jgi:hypothetical protein
MDIIIMVKLKLLSITCECYYSLPKETADKMPE